MPSSRVNSLKIKAKLLQKAKKRIGRPIPLKAAFDSLAKLAGFSSWREYRKGLDEADRFCPPGSSAFWKVWYSSYAEACSHIGQHQGYLLPYLKHYFICDEHFIENLGIALDDPDLEKVGRNWARPLNQESWQRLIKKIQTFPEVPVNKL